MQAKKKLQRANGRKSGQKKGRDPVRMCVFCKRRYSKGQLMRFVAVNGEIKKDERARLPGRGAYCCQGKRCLEFLKTKKGEGALKRALRI